MQDLEYTLGQLPVIIATRFGIGVKDERWLEHRLSLWKSVTLPSISQQTYPNWHWLLFVGDRSPDWFQKAAEQAASPIASKMSFVRSQVDTKYVQQVVKRMGGGPAILALIDDDDAWRFDYLESAVVAAGPDIAAGRDSALSFDLGLEYIVEEMVDRDLHAKGRPAGRPVEARLYRPPGAFHSMSILITSSSGMFPRESFSAHSSKGGRLVEIGFQRKVISTSAPMWLYVRHRQADSGIRKAWSERFLPSAELLGDFGLREEALNEYREVAQRLGYAVKRFRAKGDPAARTEQIGSLHENIIPQPAVEKSLDYLGSIVIGASGELISDYLTVWLTHRYSVTKGGQPMVAPSVRLVAKSPWEAEFVALELELSGSEPLAIRDVRLPAYVEGRFETRADGNSKWSPLTTWARVYDFRVSGLGDVHSDGDREL